MYISYGWLCWQSAGLVVEFRINPGLNFAPACAIFDPRPQARGGGHGQGGGEFPSRNLKMMASYTIFFSLAPSALTVNTPKFSLKHRKTLFFAAASENLRIFSRLVLNTPNLVLKPEKLQEMAVLDFSRTKM